MFLIFGGFFLFSYVNKEECICNDLSINKEKVNEGLVVAEKLFFKGEYKKALEVTMNAIDYVEPGIHNKIMKAYNEN